MRLKTRQGAGAADSYGAHTHGLQGLLRKSTVAKPTLPPRATRSFDRQAGYIITVIRKRTPAYLLSSSPPTVVSTLNSRTASATPNAPRSYSRAPRSRSLSSRPHPSRLVLLPASAQPPLAALPAPCPADPPQRGARGRMTAGLAPSSRRRAAGGGSPASLTGGARRPRVPDSWPGAPVTQCPTPPPPGPGDNLPGERCGDLRDGGARSFCGAGIPSVACALPQVSRV